MTTRLEPADLLPCPFCGGRAGAVNMSGYLSIGCIDCGASPDRKAYKEESAAIAAWNRRAAPAPDGMREAIARVIDPAAFLFGPGELEDKVYSASRAHAFDRADAILAIIAKGEGR